MSFEKDYQRKHSSVIWVSVKPTANANLEVSARSDRRGDYIDKAVTMRLSTFRAMNFGAFSFLVNRSPQMERLKLKVKKFVYYKLILKIEVPGATGTILGFDQQVRYASMAK